jgi:succinate-semialdehyde dehydrogenase/glutarate-semialdehyde dehydrogenase
MATAAKPFREEDHAAMENRMLIGGEWITSEAGTFDVRNPATGEVEAQVQNGTVEHVRAAIDAAHRAFATWSATTARERGNLLHKVAAAMRKERERLAELVTRQMGKPLKEAIGEVAYATEFVSWYAEEAKRIYGETIPAPDPRQRLLVLRQPVGVVGAITPWNYPISMVARKVAPALAAGCTVVLKPAEQTPLDALAMAEIFQACGLPAGVLNVVTAKDPAAIGNELLTNPKVRKITFTGSTEVGKLLMRGSADQLKRVSLELGGHAPFIVFDDADVELAVKAAAIAKYGNAGQACVAANRIYVQRSVHDQFVQAFAARVSKLKVGNGLAEDTRIGPLVDEPSLTKVLRQIEDARAKGATVHVGGSRLVEGDYAKGYFVAPTVLSGVSGDMLICQEETFGPVAAIIPFDTEEEVLRLANATRYGLAAYAYTRDLARAIRVYEGLEFGLVGINNIDPGVAQAPFGGWKESGLGREGGKYGLEGFLETKVVAIGI